MFKIFRPAPPTELITSTLYDEKTFYDRFIRDLKQSQQEVIIESPFMTNRRLSQLLPVFEKLKDRHVRIVVNTRDPEEHDDEYMRSEARRALSSLQRLGVHVLFTGGHHRKVVILDRKILYEGSLNVLSQHDSCEMMRRIESVQLAWQTTRFIGVDKKIR